MFDFVSLLYNNNNTIAITSLLRFWEGHTHIGEQMGFPKWGTVTDAFFAALHHFLFSKPHLPRCQPQKGEIKTVWVACHYFFARAIQDGHSPFLQTNCGLSAKMGHLVELPSGDFELSTQGQFFLAPNVTTHQAHASLHQSRNHLPLPHHSATQPLDPLPHTHANANANTPSWGITATKCTYDLFDLAH